MSTESATAVPTATRAAPRPRPMLTGRAGDPPLARAARRHRRLRPAGRRDHARSTTSSWPRPTIRHILVRHEQGAGHAAEGYAAASGKVGVAIATSGPGATNLVTAIADAHMDSVPMHRDHRPGVLDLDGNRRVPGGRHRRHHDADHQALVPRDRPGGHARRRSPRRTRSRRPAAPARCSSTSPRTRSRSSAPFIWPPKVDLPGYRPVTKAHGKQIQAAAQLLAEAKRPVLYVGGGVIRSQASAELLELAETTGAPVVTTLMARGAFPDSHPQHLGMPGMHGTVPAVLALQESRPASSRSAPASTTASPARRASSRRTPRSCTSTSTRPRSARSARPTCRSWATPKTSSSTSTAAYARCREGARRPTLAEWWARLERPARASSRSATPSPTTACSSPQYVIQRIGELTGPEGDLRRRRRPAPDVGGAVHQVRAPERLAQLRRRRHHGLRGAGGDGRQGRRARPRGLGDRRRRMLPDDQSGARHLHDQQHPDQGRDHQQLVARHGAPVADAVLRRPPLVHRPQHRARHRA